MEKALIEKKIWSHKIDGKNFLEKFLIEKNLMEKNLMAKKFDGKNLIGKRNWWKKWCKKNLMDGSYMNTANSAQFGLTGAWAELGNKVD